MADRALYRAKASGRARIEIGRRQRYLTLRARRVSTVGKLTGSAAREVAAEVQAAALVPAQRRAHDQFGADDQVAQFQQVPGDAEVGVVVVDLAAQQLDAVQGALKSLRRSDDTHVVPHHEPKFVPVVRDHHLFVRVFDLAFVPGRQLGAGRPGAAQHTLGAAAAEHDTFEQGVAGQPVGPVQPGIGRLAHRVQAGQVGPALDVGDHAAAGVVGRRHDRDRLAGDVDAQLRAAGVDGREVRAQEVLALVGDDRSRVEPDMVDAVLLHLEVDRPGHDVARRQFGALVVGRHEALADPVGPRQVQGRALAAQRLGDQEAALLRVVQAGRVELDELHVADPAAGAPGHRDAVAGGGVGVAGVAVDLADAAGGQHDGAGRQRLDAARGPCRARRRRSSAAVRCA